MDLTRKPIVVLDLETLHSADDCGVCGQTEADCVAASPHGGDTHTFARLGWERKLDLGLSVGCYWDYRDSRIHWFDAQVLEDVVRHLVETKPLLVSFNGLAFDFALMRAMLRNRWKSLDPLCDRFEHFCCAPSYDILAEIWKVDPERKFARGLNSLDALAQANGLGGKLSSGSAAPRLWREGRWAEVMNYCQSDVYLTKALFERILDRGEILRGDRQPIRLPLPLLASPATPEEA